MRRLTVICLILLLGACAHPTTRLPHEGLQNYEAVKKARRKLYRSSLKYNREMEQRIGSIHYNLMKSTGEELCDRKLKAGTGITFVRSGLKNLNNFYRYAFWDKKEYAEDYNAVHKKSFDNIYLHTVYKGSAADKAGLKPGDRLLSIYGVPAPSGKGALDDLERVIQSNNNALLPVDITVERNNKELHFSFDPDQICPYELYIDRTSRSVNAFADGKNIYVTVELIDYMRDDTALAGVMAHELAHSTLGHSRDKQHNSLIGTVFGFVADILTGTYDNTEKMSELGAGFYSQKYEMEADYLSVYYLYRAGYDISKAPNVQRLLAQRDSSSLYQETTTHPSPQERYVLLEDTIEEIKLKEAFGEDILPNFNETNTYLTDKKDY